MRDCYVIDISKFRSLRGRGINDLDRSASLTSRGPINSANNRCCWRTSTMTSVVGGESFSAITGGVSCSVKPTVKIKTQRAARPAQATGWGQRTDDRRRITDKD